MQHANDEAALYREEHEEEVLDEPEDEYEETLEDAFEYAEAERLLDDSEVEAVAECGEVPGADGRLLQQAAVAATTASAGLDPYGHGVLVADLQR